MIRYILFDLDNTLYPSSFGLEEQVSQRIQQFTAGFLGCTAEEARQRRQDRIHLYGTTLEWLMAEEGLSDIEAYYSVIHPEGEADTLEPSAEIRAFIQSLPIPSAILTNSPMEHAQRILRKLEMENLFTHIFDIRWNGLKGKPRQEAFHRPLNVLGLPAQEVLFVDDFPSYVEGFIHIGGQGVLLDEQDRWTDFPHPRIRKLTELSRYLEGT